MESLKTGAKVFWWVSGTSVLLGGGVLGYLYFNFDAEVVPGQYLGTAELTGNRDSVKAHVDNWWAQFSDSPVLLENKQLGSSKHETTLAIAGCTFDANRLKAIEYREFFADLIGSYDKKEPKRREIKPFVDCSEVETKSAAEFLTKNHPEIGAAKAKFTDGKVKLTFEANSMSLDESRYGEGLLAAAWSGEPAEFPLIQADKTVPDAELERITEVMAEFKTTFNAGKVARSANIRLAASRIDGLVLMPGESFSFNDFLGQRTVAKGFKVAGVYVSGRHDIDVGGGICQVSTTLYNAAVRSDLKIDVRFPHSLPVPYVPLGQDAAVSFPNPDFKVTNSHSFPIALSATPEKSSLTFRVLGEKKPEFTYKLESKLISSWSRGEKIVHDASLKYGQRKVMDSGGSGRKVRTWKVIYKDGKLVERVSLGDSTYSGGPRIIAVNKSAKAPAAKPAATESSPDTPG